MKNQQKLLYAFIGVLVLVVVWRVTQGMPATPGLYPTPTSSGTATKTPMPANTVAAMPQTYAQALARYQGARVQFDAYCQAIPVSLVFKNGATIMLDNRSGDARIVVVGGVQYSLAGYGWRIITLSAKTLPADLPIDCGSARNVSIIHLYK